jgi:hypothetical protein
VAIALYDKASGKRLFEITAVQRDQLVDALEEEDTDDHDYYIDAAVCEFLDGKLDAPLLAKLRALLGIKGEIGAAGGEPLETAGEDELPPPMSDEDEGIEIEWREE